MATALSPDGRTVYVANEDEGKVSAIDVGSGHILRETTVGPEPRRRTLSGSVSRLAAADVGGEDVLERAPAHAYLSARAA